MKTMKRIEGQDLIIQEVCFFPSSFSVASFYSPKTLLTQLENDCHSFAISIWEEIDIYKVV
jgi:hypothetical protein